MKLASILIAIVIAAAPAASAQTPESTQKPAAAAKGATSDVEQTLMKMERDALAALLKKDTAAFGGIFADDAVLITPDGTPQTKSQLLADVKSGDLVIESSEMSDTKVRAFGDAAVVTYITNDKGKYKGQDITGRYRWTDVFVRSAGTWKIVAGQGTPIQPPAKSK
jgi:ketosteroid isomerase-like protein